MDIRHECEAREPDCGGCPLDGYVERRQFLRDVLVRTVVAVGALGALSNRAAALSVALTSGSGARSEKSYLLPITDGLLIDREESVIIARFDDRAFAFSLACPHQNTALRWQGEYRRFQCPKHKSRYRTDGSFIEGRATRGMDRFAVRRDGEQLFVNLDALYREDKNPVEWSNAFVDLVPREK